MKILINFANDAYRKHQCYNSFTGKKVGNFDKVVEYSPSDIEDAFFEKNKKILTSSKGSGYWLWKPYFLLRALNEASEGDYIFYCDSGSYFVNSIDHIIRCAEANKEDIFLVEQALTNIQYSKKQFIDALNLSNSKWLYNNQPSAGFILLRKSENSVRIVSEYLDLCCNELLITDPQDGDVQHEEFVAHRHDQAVLSYLIFKNNLKMYRDVSQYGFLPAKYLRYGINKVNMSYGKFNSYKDSTYPIIVHLYRKEKLYKMIPRLKFRLKLKFELLLSKKVLGF